MNILGQFLIDTNSLEMSVIITYRDEMRLVSISCDSYLSIKETFWYMKSTLTLEIISVEMSPHMGKK